MSTHTLSVQLRWQQSPSWALAATLGIAAAALVLLPMYSVWIVAVLAGIALFVLSVMENETLLLGSVFLLPFAWVVNSNLPISNIVVPARILLVVGFFLGRIWRGHLRIVHFQPNYLTRATLLFFVVCTGTIIFGSVGLTHNSARALALIASYISFYFFALEWIDSPSRLEKCVRVLLISTVVVSLFGMLQEIVGGYTRLWLYLYPPDEAFIEWNGRVPSFLGYSNLLAGYLNLVLPCAFGCYLLTSTAIRKLAGWTIVLGSIALILTQSRAALLAYLLVTLLAIQLFIKQQRKKFALIGTILLLAGLVFVAGKVLSPEHLGSVVAREPMERILFWATAWRLFLASPWFGIGIGNYGDAYGQFIPSFLIPARHFTANGLYFQILSEMGLVGLVSFLVLVGIAANAGYRQMKTSLSPLSRALGFGLVGAVAATLLHGVVDLALDVSAQWGTLLWFMFALTAVSTGLDRIGNRISDV